MANTYTQLYVHIVFSIKGRQNQLKKENKEELHKYITGIIQNRRNKLMAINSMPDHIHILISMRPDISVSEIVHDIKRSATNFINGKKWLTGKFNWQEGFSAFTYAQSQIENVANYIMNQEKHHQKRTFKEEYLNFLKLFKIDYDERYVFDK